ncbi:MAG: GerAB/ArcD/ProY family transporter [Clostridia bacterium]|nr:GerAB/ArcD/ProY family transporter [Clostridia bacterium]
MNDRLGRFGRQELTAAATLLTVVCGCFSMDEAAFYRDGNVRHFATAASLLFAWLLLEIAVRRLRGMGADSLGGLLRRLPAFLSLPVSLLLFGALLLAAALPTARFLRALSSFIYIEATPAALLVYLWPCAALLALFGMETLTRTARVLLPLVLLAALTGLASDAPYYRAYRLFPLWPDGHVWLRQSVVSLLRFVPTVLMLLATARGAQGWKNVLSAGRRGLWLGGLVTLTAEVCLGLCYRYTELRSLSAPLFRLLIEIEADNASVRLDRVVLFVWTMADVYAASLAVYAAELLTAEAQGVRDVRPLAALGAGLAMATALLLCEAERRGTGALPLLYRFGWAAALLPLLAGLAAGQRRNKPCGA